MASQLLSFAGWAFLPNLVTGWIQTIYYGITIRAGDPKPQPGSPRYTKHRRRIQIAVILAYLLYTIVEADHDILRNGDFYQDLDVPHDVNEKGIKSRFRRLAALHHPDKVGPAEHSKETSDDFFRQLKLAQDTLMNPVQRFAYERFGPDMLSWQHCSNTRDYLIGGVQAYAPVYTGSAIFLVLLGVTGYLQWGRFWRYLTFASLIVLEFYTVTRPHFPPILTKLINPLLTFSNHPPLLPFQCLILARKAALTFYIALSQLAPLFQTPSPTAKSSNPNAVDLSQLQRLENLAQANEVEARRLLTLDMVPFAGDEQGQKYLKGKVKEWLVQNTIRVDPEVRDAMGRAYEKRRVGAPAGARPVR